MTIERRVAPMVEVRVSGDGKGRTIVGHAAVFNSPSRTLIGQGPAGKKVRFVERILPGAFGPALAKKPDVRATINHDPDKLLARSSKGTLSLREDDQGLYMELIAPDTTVGNDALENVRCGNLDKMSFAFSDPDDEWTADDNLDTLTRTIRSFGALHDVTLTDDPAYAGTDVDLRSYAGAVAALSRPASLVDQAMRVYLAGGLTLAQLQDIRSTAAAAG